MNWNEQDFAIVKAQRDEKEGSSQKRSAMTPAADRQRLKRQRRAEAGLVKTEIWLTERDRDTIREMAQDAKVTMSVVVTQLLKYYHS